MEQMEKVDIILELNKVAVGNLGKNNNDCFFCLTDIISNFKNPLVSREQLNINR